MFGKLVILALVVEAPLTQPPLVQQKPDMIRPVLLLDTFTVL